MFTNGEGQCGSFTNYIAYLDAKFKGPRIGHLDFQSSNIQPLSYESGAPLSTLYEVIEIGCSHIKASGDAIPLHSVQLLPPISGRDILAVGKNYAEHAKEFNSSGYDSSDKVDQPTHPVIFTKRATSIIAHEEEILPHDGFTDTVDYEGEIGVIIGKSGFQIAENDAEEYVWGYTIINDVTARERQRDHKQFYIGKSPDTFCPMGPIAVPANKLPKSLRVQTFVNGDQRQTATTDDLIFSIPFLVKTLSEGQTLQPGDVIATGTPAGVGFGQRPPTFLKSGDSVEISVTGLGTLKNKIAASSRKNYAFQRVAKRSHVPVANLSKTVGGFGLTYINSKQLYYRSTGNSSGPPVIFIHGLGGSSESYSALISSLNLGLTYCLHLLDLEGHGLSPTSASSVVTIESYTADFAALAEHANIKGATIIAHGMGCLIALSLSLKYPEVASKLVLFGPSPSPISDSGQNGLIAQAAAVRNSGMAAVVDTAITASTSAKSRLDNPLAITAVRMSLLSQDPEGYAKGCTALAASVNEIPVGNLQVDTLLITGDEDKVSPPVICEKYSEQIPNAKLHVLRGVGHWHIFEDVGAASDAMKAFLG
ncbi:fumarylacetoacetate hydrolase-like protein [Tricladium varicosporioides]|nr:fumarylacetoacetate hydrolase-like protein [Hymenoscyphus varicosporioides]